MTETNGQWAWLEQAAREAREMIDRMYAEGRSGLVDDNPAANPVDGWPGAVPAPPAP